VSSPLRRALAAPRFRRLLAARTFSRWGDIFSGVAMVVLVYRLTGSGLKVAGTVIFEIVPVLVFGLFAGAAVDRLPRVRVMVGSDLARGALALALVAVHDQLWAVYAIAFSMSAMSTFFVPAAVSVVPALVEAPEDLVGANAVMTSSAILSQILLAPVAGALVAVAGPGPAFALNAVSFFVSAALLVRLRVPAALPVPAGGRRSYVHDVREGLALLRHDPLLRALSEVQALAALSAGATSALLVVLSERHLRVGPERFGLLLTAIGVGHALGPLALQRVVSEVRRPALLFGPLVVRGLVDVVLVASTSLGVAVVALVVYGLATNTGGVTFNTLLQRSVDDRARGRVFAFFDVVWQAARLTSVAAGGILADRVGVGGTYVLAGVVMLAAGALGFAKVPTPMMRRDDPLPGPAFGTAPA